MHAALEPSERLRVLALLGVDVYVPRPTPLARPRVARDGDRERRDPAALPLPHAPPPRASIARPPRVRVSCANAEQHARLLTAVMRGARIRPEEWTLDDEPRRATLPLWRFGAAGTSGEAAPTVTLPDLARLRDSVVERRAAWLALRSWLRRA